MVMVIYKCHGNVCDVLLCSYSQIVLKLHSVTEVSNKLFKEKNTGIKNN